MNDSYMILYCFGSDTPYLITEDSWIKASKKADQDSFLDLVAVASNTPIRIRGSRIESYQFSTPETRSLSREWSKMIEEEVPREF